MKRIVLSVLLVSLFSTAIEVSEPVYTFLVYRPKISTAVKSDIITKGYTDIKSVPDKQPFRITHYFTECNTNYALLEIVPLSDLEKLFLTNLYTNSYILLISTRDVCSIFDKQKGDIIKRVIRYNVNKLPDDFYSDFSVKISSK